MRMMNRRNEKGFTLIEVVVSLILLGIVAATAGMGLVTSVQGYMFCRQNGELIGKGETAITRIIKELADCTVTAGNATSISWTRSSANGGASYTFSWDGVSGHPLVLTDTNNNSDTLTDIVSSIAFAYYDNGGNVVAASVAKQVQVTMQLIGSGNFIQTINGSVYVKLQQ